MRETGAHRYPQGPGRQGPDRHGPDRHGPDRHGPDRHGPDRHGPDRQVGLDRLLSPEGRELLGLLPEGPLDPGEELAVGTRLRERFPAELVAGALGQHALRVRGAGKFSRAAGMWFTREGLEQASGEALATYRAGRYAGFDVVADLCCGIGGDLIALAPGRAALAVDLDLVHLRMARENARLHGAGEVAVACADVQTLNLPRSLAVFADPARREGGRRLPAGGRPPPPR